jgi:hypothetical protein
VHGRVADDEFPSRGARHARAGAGAAKKKPVLVVQGESS